MLLPLDVIQSPVSMVLSGDRIANLYESTQNV